MSGKPRIWQQAVLEAYGAGRDGGLGAMYMQLDTMYCSFKIVKLSWNRLGVHLHER